MKLRCNNQQRSVRVPGTLCDKKTDRVEFLPQIEQRPQLVGPDVLVELARLGVGALENAQLRHDGAADHALRRPLDVLRQPEVRRLVELGQSLHRLDKVLKCSTTGRDEPV